MDTKNIGLTVYKLEKAVADYLKGSGLRSAVIGISGGIDSALNTVILNRVARRLPDFRLIGRYIGIAGNKDDEKERAERIGGLFCDDFKSVNLDLLYGETASKFNMMEELDTNAEETEHAKKVRYGNIKARLRMMYLYNLAQMHKGLVIDNDNMTEHLLGFFTLHGDVGDLTPLASFLKTEVYDVARYYVNEILENQEEKEALSACIECNPTDGLGITETDLDQLGAESYEAVDTILKCKMLSAYWPTNVYNELCKKYGINAVNKVLVRNENSAFKRNNPYRISISGCALSIFVPFSDDELEENFETTKK